METMDKITAIPTSILTMDWKFSIPVATGAHTTTMFTILMAITLSTNNHTSTIGLLMEAIPGTILTLITMSWMVKK